MNQFIGRMMKLKNFAEVVYKNERSIPEELKDILQPTSFERPIKIENGNYVEFKKLKKGIFGKYFVKKWKSILRLWI